MRQGVANRLFGDFVKNQAMDRHLRVEHFAEMPTNGLPFAVFVRRQIEIGGLLQSGLQLADLLDLLRRNDVDRVEVLCGIHSQVGPTLLLHRLGHLFGPVRQIADVSDTGLDGVTWAEELADGAGLGRRLDNHQRIGVGIGLFLRHVNLGNLGK